MSYIKPSSTGNPDSKLIASEKSRVQVKRLTREEAIEFRARMGLPNSYLVIGNTIKGGRR